METGNLASHVNLRWRPPRENANGIVAWHVEAIHFNAVSRNTIFPWEVSDQNGTLSFSTLLAPRIRGRFVCGARTHTEKGEPTREFGGTSQQAPLPERQDRPKPRNVAARWVTSDTRSDKIEIRWDKSAEHGGIPIRRYLYWTTSEATANAGQCDPTNPKQPLPIAVRELYDPPDAYRGTLYRHRAGQERWWVGVSAVNRIDEGPCTYVEVSN